MRRAGLLAALVASACAAGTCDEVFVSNELSGDLSIIDARTLTVTATVALGKRPRGLKLSPDGRTLYVALSGSPLAGPGVDASTLPPADKSADGIGVVDVAARRLERVLRGVSDPEQLAISADGSTLFVASEDEGLAVIMDTRGTIRARVPVGGEAEGTNISPDGRVVYVTSEAEHAVTALDAASGRALARITVGRRPRSTAFSADAALAFVTNEADASVTVIDARAHRVLRTLRLAAGSLPMGITAAPDGRLHVSTGRARRVVTLDGGSGAELAGVETGTRPWGLALDARRGRLYAANGPSDDVAVIDSRTQRLLGKIPAGQRPWGVTCAPETRAPAALSEIHTIHRDPSH